MTREELYDRRSHLINKWNTQHNNLSNSEHNELHKLSQQLIDMYRTIVDINEITDEDLEDQDGFQ